MIQTLVSGLIALEQHFFYIS